MKLPHKELSRFRLVVCLKTITEAFLVAVVILAPGLIGAQSYRATYDYDPRGRLTSVSYATINASGTPVGTARSLTFSYDNASNRTLVERSAPTAGNYAPFAGNDAYVAIPEVLLELNVLWNDNDLNGDAIFINYVSPGGASEGFYAWTDGRRIFYKATASATSPHTLTYTITDGASTAPYPSASITISMDEIISAYWSGNFYDSSFTGLEGSGMRDWNFGTSPPAVRESTLYLSRNADFFDTISGTMRYRQVFLYLGPEPTVVSRIAVAPIHSTYATFQGIDYSSQHFLTSYISYSADGNNWYGSDENIVQSPTNNYLQIDMDEILAKWIVITMPRASAHLGIGDFRVFGVGSGNGGGGLAPMSLRAVPDGEMRFVAPATIPRAKQPRFAHLLPPVRPFRRPGEVVDVLVDASSANGMPPALDSEPPPPQLASLAGSSPPMSAERKALPREHVPKSYLSSSQLTIAGVLDGDGLRDGRFVGDSSVLRTSTSSSEFLIAELTDVQSLSRIDLAPVEGEDRYRLQGASIYTSTDCQRWTWLASLGEVKQGGYTSISAQGVDAKCVKIEMTGSYLSVGDLRIY